MLNIVLFSGGNGNGNLIKAIAAKIADGCLYKLNIIINGFDDGKSTGLVRSRFNILGPSDIRKNHVALLSPNNIYTPTLDYILSYRSVSYQDYKDKVNLIVNDKYDSIIHNYNLLPEQTSIIKECLIKFEEQEFVQNQMDSFIDFSIANAIYSGAYLIGGYELVYKLGSIFGCVGEVFFASHDNRYLVGIDNYGKLYFSENSIDSAYDAIIKDVYLVKEPLNTSDKIKLKNIKNLQHRKNYLLLKEQISTSNESVDTIITNADIIIYGSGTLSTSLLPTYKIKNISYLISENNHAVKFIVTNIIKEYEDNWTSISEIINSTLMSLNQPMQYNLIHKAIINIPFYQSKYDRYIIDDSFMSYISNIEIIKANLQESLDSSRHNGFALLDVIINNLK